MNKCGLHVKLERQHMDGENQKHGKTDGQEFPRCEGGGAEGNMLTTRSLEGQAWIVEY